MSLLALEENANPGSFLVLRRKTGPAQLLRCYRSLTIFNKIGAWTAALALLLPLFGLMLLPHASLLMQLYPLVIMGLPCPNLGTGTFNHHGVTEFANIRQMNQCVELIKELLTIQ